MPRKGSKRTLTGGSNALTGRSKGYKLSSRTTKIKPVKIKKIKFGK